MANKLDPELEKRFVNPLLQVSIATGKLLINRLAAVSMECQGYYRHEEAENEE